MVQLNTGQLSRQLRGLFVAARDSCLALEPATGEAEGNTCSFAAGLRLGLPRGGRRGAGGQQPDFGSCRQQGRRRGQRAVFLEAVVGRQCPGLARLEPTALRSQVARRVAAVDLRRRRSHDPRIAACALLRGEFTSSRAAARRCSRPPPRAACCCGISPPRTRISTALDLHTGKPVWEKPLGDLVADHTINQCSKDGVLVLLRSHFDAQHFAHYTLHGSEAATGKPLWSNDVAYSTPGIGTMTNLHNRTLTQPTLVGNTVLLATTSYQGGRRGLQAFRFGDRPARRAPSRTTTSRRAAHRSRPRPPPCSTAAINVRPTT